MCPLGDPFMGHQQHCDGHAGHSIPQSDVLVNCIAHNHSRLYQHDGLHFIGGIHDKHTVWCISYSRYAVQYVDFHWSQE